MSDLNNNINLYDLLKQKTPTNADHLLMIGISHIYDSLKNSRDVQFLKKETARKLYSNLSSSYMVNELSRIITTEPYKSAKYDPYSYHYNYNKASPTISEMSNMRDYALTLLFESCATNNVDISKVSEFSNLLEIYSSKFSEYLENTTSYLYSDAPNLFYIAVECAFMLGKIDMDDIFEKRYSTLKYRPSSVDVAFINAYTKRNKEKIISIIEDSEFQEKYFHHGRAAIYGAICQTGFMTKKAARKIRSDQAESASYAGSEAIISNIDKYIDKKEILAQLLDTKHIRSLRLFANNLPKDLLLFLAGCNEQEIMSIISQRMEEKNN